MSNKDMVAIARQIITKNNYTETQVRKQFPLMSRLGLVSASKTRPQK